MLLMTVIPSSLVENFTRTFRVKMN